MVRNRAPEEKPVQIHQRRTLRQPLIVLQLRETENRRTFFGYARNLSRGGMFISSSNPHDPGRRFLIEFPLPGAPELAIRCTCEVVWNRNFSSECPYEPGMGLRFIDLTDNAASSIDAWAQSV